MFFKRNHGLYNLPSSYYLNTLFLHYSNKGNITKEGKIGPSTSNSISKSKKVAVKKGYSELQERRSLMVGGYGTQKYVTAFDLIKKDIINVEKKYSEYLNNDTLKSDTTGTGCHNISERAVYKAYTELLEKNALYLLWYGKEGEIIQVNSPLLNLFEEKNLKVYILKNTSFAPFYTIATIITDGVENIFSTGINTDLSISISINNSIKEAILLFWQNQRNFSTKRIKNSQEAISYIKSFSYEKNIQNLCFEPPKYNIVLSCLPSWIENLYMIKLKNSNNNNLKVVEVFSPQMHNHTPTKEKIKLNSIFNKKTLNLNEKDLNDVPECFII